MEDEANTNTTDKMKPVRDEENVINTHPVGEEEELTK